MWARPARTRMMGWRTYEPTAFFAAGQPQDVPVVPEAVVTTPTIISDFKNGIYTINGAVVGFGDIWVFDPVLWGAVTTPIAGDGLTISTSANASSRAGPKLNSSVFASLSMPANPSVVVMEYTLSKTGTGEATVFYEANDAPAFVHGVGFLAVLGGTFEGAQVYNYPDLAPPISVPGMTPGFHRSAALLNLALGGCGLSTNGAASTAGTNDDDSTDATGAGILVQVNGHSSGTATATLSKVAIYPTQPLSVLSALSA